MDLKALALSVTKTTGSDVEKAELIRRYVRETVEHDYYKQPLDEKGEPILDPLKLIKLGYGRCGHRASLFQRLAMEAGLQSRIILSYGHIYNQVYVGDDSEHRWREFDCYEPRDEFEQRLYDIIKRGPVYGVCYVPDYVRNTHVIKLKVPEDTYSNVLLWLKKNVNVVLPRDILDGKTVLSDKQPNVVVRHDVCSDPDAWLPFAYKENQYGVKTVTYVRVDGAEYDFERYAPMFQKYEPEGFEIGLHVTAVDRHGLELAEAVDRCRAQMESARRFLDVRTVQAHGYDDRFGVPKVTNYDVEDSFPYGFRRIVEGTKRFEWRIADSLGVMYPHGDVLSNLRRMKKGRLYYCLWHPEHYEFRDYWIRFKGVYSESFSEDCLRRVLPKIRARLGDSPYFDTVPTHLWKIGKYLADRVIVGDTLIDLACGWGLLNIIIRDRASLFKRLVNKASFEYIGVENSFGRVKAGQALHMAVGLRIPRFVCDDLVSPRFSLSGKWVVFVGWEGDADGDRVLDNVAGYVASNGFLLMSWIDRERYVGEKWEIRYGKPLNPYFLLSRSEVLEYAYRHGLVACDSVTGVYADGFPRMFTVFKKVN